MTSASRWGLTVLMALAVLVASATAAAQPSESDKATARALMDRGDKMLAEGNLEEARKAYKGADAIMQVPTTGIELGKVQMKMGKLLEATSTFLRVARFPKQDGEPAVFTDSRAEAKKLAADIKDRIPSVVLELKGLKPGASAEVKIDGSVLPPATLTLPRQVNPGKHEVTGTAAGYKSITTSFEVEEGKTQELILEFEEGAGEAAPPPPPPPAKPSPQPDGGDDGDDSGGGGGGIGPLTIAGFSIGGVGIIVGAITGGLSLRNNDELRSTCAADDGDETTCPETATDDLALAETVAHVSTVGFAVGGAGIALGIVGLILDFSGGDASAEAGSGKTQLRPLIGAGYLGVEGSF